MAGRNGRTVFTYELYIAASSKAVWRAIVDPDMTERYFSGMRFDGVVKKGAPYALRAGDEVATDGRIVEVVPAKRLRMTWRGRWNAAVEEDAPSRVTYEIEAAGKVTRLRLVHDRFDGETATYRATSAGWPAVLSSLKTLLESGKPLALKL
ncbi:MAG TPA: SRPBCC family protein [Gemmatimonadaceae bacterium]|nr:SRPBCC family protein [Gemmatimonadaceae bacterium]